MTLGLAVGRAATGAEMAGAGATFDGPGAGGEDGPAVVGAEAGGVAVGGGGAAAAFTMT